MKGNGRTPMQTPAKKPMSVTGKSSSSICGSQNPGPSSREITYWKGTIGEVPDDDSDQGEMSAFGVQSKARIRKRRGTGSTIAGTGGGVMAWMSQHSRANSSAILSRSNSVSSIGKLTTATTTTSVKKSLFPPTIFSQSSNGNHAIANADPHRALSQPTDNVAPPEVNSNLPSRQKKQGGREAAVPDNRKPAGVSPRALITTANQVSKNMVPPIPARAVPRQENIDGFIFYTVWFPAWDVIWKCDNGKVPLRRNKDFCKLIYEVLYKKTGPDLDDTDTQDLRVLKIQGTEGVEDSYRIFGIDDESTSSRRKKIIKWKPSPRVLRKLLEGVVSSSDIVVQCISKKILDGSKGKVLIIHITSKEGKKMDFYKVLGEHVQLSSYHLKYEHYMPKIVKCWPICRKTSTSNEDQSSENVPMENQIPPPALEAATPQLPTDSSIAPAVVQRPTMETSLLAPCPSGSDGSSAQLVINNNEIDNAASPQVDIEMEDVQDESDASNAEETNHQSSHRVAANPESTGSNFDVENFVKRGSFVPGPMRPKAKKSKGSYVYNTLEELSNILQATIEEEQGRGVIPNMMIKDQRHVFGLVDDIVPQYRHENARFVRISDETSLTSTLVRLHSSSTETPGPAIDVGNIIRIHRVTVQDEWDTDFGENRMVISTSAHRNYVLFEQSSEENQFYFNSSAKNITLTEYDTRRVAELYKYKCSRSSRNDEEVVDEAPVVVPHNILDRGSNVQLIVYAPGLEYDVVRRSPEGSEDQVSVSNWNSEGICPSDLASPTCTLGSVGNRNSEDSLFPLNESNINPVSNGVSDESFISAISGGMDHEDGQNEHHHDMEGEMDLGNVQPRPNSQNGCTLFKDLVRTSRPLKLLCQVIKCGVSSKTNSWQLILKDIEHTTPADDFKMNRLSEGCPQVTDDCLVVNVTDAASFENRNFLSILFDGQGTDALYSIENVTVKGSRPPYQLEVNGGTCEIMRDPYFVRGCLQDYSLITSYSERGNNSSSHVQNNMIDTGVRCEFEDEMPPCADEVDGAHIFGDPQANPARPEPVNDGDIGNDSVIGGGSGSDVPDLDSTFMTAEQSPSQSPAKPVVGRKRAPESKPAAEPWTGRLTRKRKPREFYQAEDSFSC